LLIGSMPSGRVLKLIVARKPIDNVWKFCDRSPFSNPTKGLFMGYENSPIFSDETPGKKVFLHLRGIREETLLR